MTREEIRLQVAISALQGVLEAKFGIVGEALPSVAVEESLRIADEFVKQWFKDGEVKNIEQEKEQKPTKWSDTDNIGWDEAFACVTRAERTAKNEEELQNAVTAEKWLKEIKFKYCVHPVKQDWSEDDEHRLNQIIDVCDRNGYPILSKWLKFLPERFNLQPKVEWSEEDVRHLYNIIFAIKNTYKNNEDYKVQLISWLKSLRPQPHWKPSEEQIRALEIVTSAKGRKAPVLYEIALDELLRDLNILGTGMKRVITKEAFSAITDILRTKYGLDELDVVEFAMETERKLQIQIPDDWFGCGRIHTVRKNE